MYAKAKLAYAGVPYDTMQEQRNRKNLEVKSNVKQAEGISNVEVAKQAQMNDLEVRQAYSMLDPEKQKAFNEAMAKSGGDINTFKNEIEGQIKIIEAQMHAQGAKDKDVFIATYPYQKILTSLSNPSTTPFTMSVLGEMSGTQPAQASPQVSPATGASRIGGLLQPSPTQEVGPTGYGPSSVSPAIRQQLDNQAKSAAGGGNAAQGSNVPATVK